jgi:hypothetical protein
VSVLSALPALIARRARAIGRRPEVRWLADRLPISWRLLLQSRLVRLRRLASVHDFPRRLEFPEKAKESPRFRVVVYGAFFEIWNPALMDRALWQTMPGVIEVRRVAERLSLRILPPAGPDTRTVIVPLGEEHYRQSPRQFLSLAPDAASVATLANKAAFAAHAARLGLSRLCPATYRTPAEIRFPCILKRVDLAGAMGIEFVRSRLELDRLLDTPTFRGQETTLQAFVPGVTEYVTHCVFKNGALLWHCTFAWALDPDVQFGIPDFGATIAVTASDRTLAEIGRLLEPLRYSGPCCVNYKLSPGGEISIFEINPRLGGSLMNPRNIDCLRQALAHIVANAEPAPSRRTSPPGVVPVN